MKTLLTNLSKETLVSIILNLQQTAEDLRDELDYDTKHLLGLLDQVVERDRTIIEELQQKEFSMAQCIGELENDVDELTQLYLDQLERTNEVGKELWELKMQDKVEEHNEDCPEWHEYTDVPF